MAGKIEAIPGEPILSEVRELSGYTQRLYGAVEKLEPTFTNNGSTIILAGGQIVCLGKIIILDKDGIKGTLPPASKNTSFYTFLVIDMENKHLSLEFSEVENPQAMRKDNIYADPFFGIHWMLVGEVLYNYDEVQDLLFHMKKASDPETVFEEGGAKVGTVIDLKYTPDELEAVNDIIIDLDNPNVTLTGRISPLAIIRCSGVYVSTAPNINAVCCVELRPASNSAGNNTLYRVSNIRISYTGNTNPGPAASIMEVKIKW